MIDLHSHLLPGVDDGSRSVAQSVAVLERMAAEGVTRVVLTPHVSAGAIARDAEAVLGRRGEAYEGLRAAAPPVPALELGFEIMLDQPLPEAALGDRRLALAASRYYLVEFHLGVVPAHVTRILAQFAAAGAVPLVAHPERYAALTVDGLWAWRDVGARMQLDATALTRPGRRGEGARRYLAAGLGDVIAADNHGDGRTMRAGAAFLRAKGRGARDAVAEAVELLTIGNPAAVVADGELSDVPGIEIRGGVWESIRRLFG